MRRRLSELLLVAAVLAPAAAAAKDDVPDDAFAPTAPAAPAATPANGSIFQGGYVPLTSGGRAGRVGDIITIQLVERTIASKSSASGTNRDSSFGLSPPTTGPLSLFLPSDIGMGGGSDFKGKGEASQSNRLARSEEHTSELQSLMRISYAVF